MRKRVAAVFVGALVAGIFTGTAGPTGGSTGTQLRDARPQAAHAKASPRHTMFSHVAGRSGCRLTA